MKEENSSYIASKAQFNYENHAQNNQHIRTPTFIPFKKKEKA